MIATSPLHNIRGKNLCTPGLDGFPCSGLGLHLKVVPIRSPLSQVNADGRDTVAMTVFVVVIVVTGFVVELVMMIAVIVVVVGMVVAGWSWKWRIRLEQPFCAFTGFVAVRVFKTITIL